MKDKEYKDNVYAYQGQLKASSMPQGRFVPIDSLDNEINYFDRINQIYDGQISYINRLAIYWDKPNNSRVDQPDQQKAYIKIAGNGSQQMKFEIGHNHILEFHEPDLQITSIKVTQQSSPKCFFDFIAV